MPPNITRYSSLETLKEASCAAALIISDQRSPWSGRVFQPDMEVVLFRPRTLIAGMGCRRGVPVAELEELLVNTFEDHNLAVRSLRCIATAELKQEEPGLIQLADKYGVSLLCYTGGQLNSVFDPRRLAREPKQWGKSSQPPFRKWGRRGTVEKTVRRNNPNPRRERFGANTPP